MKTVEKIAFIVSLVCVAFWIGLKVGGPSEKNIHITEITPSEELTDWAILEMAIAMTESAFDQFAVGKTQDLGIFQATPIYVREVNRLIGENTYSHLDAFDIEKSIEMFNIIQDYHNKDKDIEKAINIHNPGGHAIGYMNKVYSNILLIKRAEAVRRAIVDYEHRKSNEETPGGVGDEASGTSEEAQDSTGRFVQNRKWKELP